jgi:hypothetical protein
MYFIFPCTKFEAQTISQNSKLFRKSVTIALLILVTEPQLNCCSDFIVRSVVTSSQAFLRFAKEMKPQRYQIEAIWWVIQESNTKAPNPCNCFHFCAGSSIVQLKERLLHTRDKLPEAGLSAFLSASQYCKQLMIVPVSMNTECTTPFINGPENLSINFASRCPFWCLRISVHKKISFVHIRLSAVWVRNSLTGRRFIRTDIRCVYEHNSEPSSGTSYNSIRGTGKSMNAVHSLLLSVFRISNNIRMQ